MDQSQQREEARKLAWMEETRVVAMKLLKLLVKEGTDIKPVLQLLKSRYFTQDLGMLIHYLNNLIHQKRKFDP